MIKSIKKFISTSADWILQNSLHSHTLIIKYCRNYHFNIFGWYQNNTIYFCGTEKQFSQPDLSSPSKLKPFKPPQMSRTLRELMGRDCGRPVRIAGYPLKLRGEFLTYHNLYHFEMSRLERILIGKDMVSGIHGFYSQMFHDTPIEIEYDGVLDEARLAVHEWMTRTSFYNTFKLVNWSIWFVSQGINPFAVIFRHAKSLWRFKKTSNQPIVEACFEFHQYEDPVQLSMTGENLKKVQS